MNDYLVLILADERARIYPEGQIGYDTYMGNVGWVLNEFDGHGGTGPTLTFIRIAEAARAAYLVEETRRERRADREAFASFLEKIIGSPG